MNKTVSCSSRQVSHSLKAFLNRILTNPKNMSKFVQNLFVWCFIFGIVSCTLGVSLNPFSGFRYPFLNRRQGYHPLRQAYPGYYPGGGGGLGGGIYQPTQGCPICDSSIFGYCSHKLVHDTCCCGDVYYAENSFECQYNDCSYLHANSCKESELIATCCCEELDPYRSYNPYRLFNKK